MSKNNRKPGQPTPEEVQQGMAEAYAANLPAVLRAHWHDRVPPSNDRAEQVLLGALMANNKATTRLGAFLKAEHFVDPAHRSIFAAIERRVKAGQLADVVTLTAEYEHSPVLEEAGGTAYLQQLVTTPEGIIDVGRYAEAISDSWLRREIIDDAEQVAVLAGRAIDAAFGVPVGGASLDGAETARRLIAELQRHITLLAEKADSLRAPF